MDKVDVRFPQPSKAPAANLPKNAEERAAALIELMDRLSAHLARETEAVMRHCTSAELARLGREKQPMMLVYEEVSRLLRVDREGMAALPDEAKAALREATRGLYEASAANADALRRNSAAQKILVDTVVGAINRARQTTTPAYGTAPVPPRATYITPSHGPSTSATLNTRL
ncbi:flagellar basal-body protein [Azospirillum argentinense]